MKLLITADWHIRKTKPICRTDDDWMETQRKAVAQVLELAIKYGTDVCIVGDLFHANSDTDFECLQIVQDFALGLKRENLGCYILAGNHDLLYHSSLNVNRSAIGILFNSENIHPISSLGDDVSAPNFDEAVKDNLIVFRHILTFPDKESMPPNVEAKSADDLLDDTPSAEWIFTGDYHHNFHVERDGRHVINPGCLIRQVVDFIDYKPVVYIVDTERKKIIKKYISDEVDFVDNTYIIKQEERENRIGDFVDGIKHTESVSLDFIDNVRKALNDNKLSDELVAMVEELIA